MWCLVKAGLKIPASPVSQSVDGMAQGKARQMATLCYVKVGCAGFKKSVKRSLCFLALKKQPDSLGEGWPGNNCPIKGTCFIWFCELADTDMRLTLGPHVPVTLSCKNLAAVAFRATVLIIG